MVRARQALLLASLVLGAAPCWARSGTPTPTPTPRPLATGDLGTRTVHGQVRDGSQPTIVGIAGATVWVSHFARLGGADGPSALATDAGGNFTTALFLHDTDTVTIGVEAAGFQPRVLHFSGYEFYSSPPLDLALLPLTAGAGHRVSGTLRGTFCDAPTGGAVVGLAPTGRRVVTGSDGAFTFEDVADGDYTLNGPRCFGVPCVPPAEIVVAGADVSAELCQALCSDELLIEPAMLRAGDALSVSGFCYPLHSGRQADVALDDAIVGEVRGNTSGDFTACITVPSDASPGWHALRVTNGETEHAAGQIFVVAHCGGDCDSDGTVGVDELVRGVSIALGVLPPEACAAVDTNGSTSVTIDELIGALDRALRGCGIPSPASLAGEG